MQITILLADDDRLILATLSKGLRDAGFHVLEAADGKEALQAAYNYKPDLAILDMRMPELMGNEVAQILTKELAIPVLYLSAYSDHETVEKALSAGGMNYIVKPVNLEQLLIFIESALQRSQDMMELQQSKQRLIDALKHKRSINTAVGLLMERHKISENDAFNVLRNNARNQRRKLYDLADEIVTALSAINQYGQSRK